MVLVSAGQMLLQVFLFISVCDNVQTGEITFSKEFFVLIVREG